jgi:hypothetical protein
MGLSRGGVVETRGERPALGRHVLQIFSCAIALAVIAPAQSSAQTVFPDRT